MLTSTAPGAVSSLRPTAYRLNTEREAVKPAAQTYSHYDSVSISSPTGDNRFHMDLLSRLSQSVRTATTTGDIHALRSVVAAGQYIPDPEVIASRMLLLGEDL